MANLYGYGSPKSEYKDKDWRKKTDEEHQRALEKSTTLYVGNLSFYTTEEQLWELFSRCGDIKRIIMGLDRIKLTPCGFCFIEYYRRSDAEDCFRYINGTRLDDRIIRTDWDAGFKEDRQFGRGMSGGQVRDEYRDDYDPGRGGYGKQRQQLIEYDAPYRESFYPDYYSKEYTDYRRGGFKRKREEEEQPETRPNKRQRTEASPSSRFRDGGRESDED